MSDSVQTPSEFRKRIAEIRQNLRDEEIDRNMKRTLYRIAGHIRKAVGHDLTSSLPHIGRRADKAVVRTVYKNLTGFRVRITNSLKNGMIDTGRPSQPRLPLAYWYEHGFKAHRMTRFRIGRVPVDRGPSSPVAGAHVLDRHQSDLDWAEREYLDALIEYLLPELDKING